MSHSDNTNDLDLSLPKLREPTDLKNTAFLLLSDSKLLKKKVLNPHQLGSFLRVDTIMDDYSLQGKARGAVIQSSFGLRVDYSPDLNRLEQNFEIMTLLSTAYLQQLNSRLRRGFGLYHSNDDNDGYFAGGAKLAAVLLTFNLTDREIKLATGKDGNKYVSKIANKRGIPTQVLLKRIGEELSSRNLTTLKK